MKLDKIFKIFLNQNAANTFSKINFFAFTRFKQIMLKVITKLFF